MIPIPELEALRSLVQGPVSGPEDPGYALEAFNPSVVQRPEAVLAAVDTADVQNAVRWAADAGIPVGVQATGHGAASAMDEGLLISTSGLQDLRLDPDAGTVALGAGVRWKAVLEEAVPHGFTGPHGSSGTVGVTGYATGGGLPVMGRALGFCSDHVQSMDVVTPDGAMHHASPEGEDAELFAVLRGGKANFGVVTSLTLGLNAFTGFYGGGLMYPEESGPQVLEAFRGWTEQLPSDASASIAFLRLPDAPFVPAELRGTAPVHVRFACFGSAEAGDTLLEPMRRAIAPLMDTAGPMDYRAVGSIHMDPDGPIPAMDTGALLTDLSNELAGVLLDEVGPGSGSPLLMAEVRLMGGALAVDPPVPDAVSGRSAGFNLYAVGLNAPPVADATAAALGRLNTAMEPYTGGALVNLSGSAPAGTGGQPFWSSDVLLRLQAAKAAYDPENLFRFGHAVPLPVP